MKDLNAEMKSAGYDAAFLGAGASLAHRAYIPAGDAAHILDAVSVLRSMEAPAQGEETPMLGRRVACFRAWNRTSHVSE